MGPGVSVTRTEGQLGKRHPAAPFEALGQPFSQRLSGRDVAMGWILAVMIAFGVCVGVAFPFLVRPLIDLRPGQESTFRLACVLAGLCVGGFAYGVARFTLYSANRRLARLAAYDSLTGLYNQRQFVNTLGSELARAKRAGQRVSLLIVDLDHFKRVNDEHGHLIGNDVLVAVAGCIACSLRPFDMPCRIGGEEFAIVLPGAGKPEAEAVARAHSSFDRRACRCRSAARHGELWRGDVSGGRNHHPSPYQPGRPPRTRRRQRGATPFALGGGVSG